MFEKKRAPPPLPAETILTANARFIPNHCDTMGPVTTMVNPSPMANRTPCVRYKCQICVENPARICPATRHTQPSSIENRQWYVFESQLLIGAMASARLSESEPMNA